LSHVQKKIYHFMILLTRADIGESAWRVTNGGILTIILYYGKYYGDVLQVEARQPPT
jgi:hypothetical protein